MLGCGICWGHTYIQLVQSVQMFTGSRAHLDMMLSNTSGWVFMPLLLCCFQWGWGSTIPVQYSHTPNYLHTGDQVLCGGTKGTRQQSHSDHSQHKWVAPEIEFMALYLQSTYVELLSHASANLLYCFILSSHSQMGYEIAG